MSLETTEGIEEIQEDVAEKVEALDKKLRIHLPRKQPSYSIVSSRRSSLNVVAASNGQGTDKEVPQLVKKKKNDKNPSTFSTNKEKTKISGKKKKKVKALQKMVKGNQKLKDISDKNAKEDDYDEDYESEPDVSEILLIKPKVDIKNEDNGDDIPDKPKTKLKKKKRKRGTNKSGKRKRSKIFSSSDQAASEIERLLAEKDKLLRAELAKLDPDKAPSKPDSSFYPPPKNLEKRRCYFHRGAKALKCTVCSGGISDITHLILPALNFNCSSLSDQENIQIQPQNIGKNKHDISKCFGNFQHDPNNYFPFSIFRTI